MYLNKVYDCDTCDSKDNDGGNTIPSELDPATDTKCYAGRGSILWNDLRRCENQEMVIDADGNTLTLPGVVATMRNLPEIPGVGAGPFSPQGHYYYSVTKRMKTWPKVVSSYDGERKYINYKNSNDLYYYALQGLGLTSLPAFIEQRWRIRDGYYQTGDFKDARHVLGGRIGAKEGAVIRFRAAKDGYFGIGNDGGNVTQGMFLKAGEEGVFDQFQHGDNVLLYIYQADRMSEIDLSEISIDVNFQFSVMKLAQRIIIGSMNHTTDWKLSTGNSGFLQTMNLGELPFLTHLNVQCTEVRSINASKCPRLEEVLAAGSELTSITTAETAPITTLELPDSITELNLINLPKLSYPGGLTIAGVGNINRLMLGGCPNIDPLALVNAIVEASNLRLLRLPNLHISAPSSALVALKNSGAKGLDPNGQAYEEVGQCSGVSGQWICTDMVDDALLDKNVAGSLASYFPELKIHNCQYSYVMFDDTMNDSQNITNPDNGTIGDAYKPTGHFVRLAQKSHAYKSTYNRSTKRMSCVQVSDENYNYLADGSEYDPTDTSGLGFDIMKLIPAYWYKGINDFKNQKKYLFLSTTENEPISSIRVRENGTKRINRAPLSELLVQPLSSVYVVGDDNNPVQKGSTPKIAENPNFNVCEIDVDGMKQVRWPGINNGILGAVFVDGEGKVISSFCMSISHSLFDFVPGEYIFCDVSDGAKKFMFTCPTGFDTLEAIAVDSNALEAIDPDWVRTRNRLVGVYGLSIDSLMRPRSISGQQTRRGDNNSNTNVDWQYDQATGKVINATVPTSAMHYTYTDFMNLCNMRGEGFQAIDYEMSKDLANIIMALTGDRDFQAYGGYGCRSDYYTGGNNANTYGNVTRKGSSSGDLGNIAFGIQNFVACCYEWMDNVVVNAISYKSWKKNKCLEQNADPINAVWHIYDPITDTERTVQGINADGYCIGRVKFGRYCDVIASRVTSDRSAWNMNYSDGQYYSHSKCRVVGRANYGASAYGGLVYANANYASAYSFSGYGSRLAFIGDIDIVS